MLLYLAVGVIGLAVTALFLAMRVKEGGIRAMFTKAAASICFIGTALAAFAYNKVNFEYALLIILGLVFSMLGDIWLDLKYVHKESSDIYTFVGFGSFMFAHAFFIPAVLMGFHKYNWWYFLIDAVVCIALVINTVAMEKNKKVSYGKFRIITIIYTVFVMGTMLFAVNGLIASGFKSTKYIILALAGTLFAVSDLVLCYIYFGNRNNSKYVLANHILYYLAQFLFASSIIFD